MVQTSDSSSIGETPSRASKSAVRSTGEALPVTAESVTVEVVKLKKGKKKKKRKYTRGTKNLQQVSRGMNKASARVARAIASGFASYDKSSRKSSRKRRDGAAVDFAENWARAVGRSMRIASRAPFLVARQLPTKVVRRQVRSAFRLAFPVLWLR